MRVYNLIYPPLSQLFMETTAKTITNVIQTVVLSTPTKNYKLHISFKDDGIHITTPYGMTKSEADLYFKKEAKMDKYKIESTFSWESVIDILEEQFANVDKQVQEIKDKSNGR